jgi:hypothetical protein
MIKEYLPRFLLIFLVAAFLFISFAATSYGDDELSLNAVCDNIFFSKYNQNIANLACSNLLLFQRDSEKSFLKQIILYIERNEKSPPTAA